MGHYEFSTTPSTQMPLYRGMWVCGSDSIFFQHFDMLQVLPPFKPKVVQKSLELSLLGFKTFSRWGFAQSIFSITLEARGHSVLICTTNLIPYQLQENNDGFSWLKAIQCLESSFLSCDVPRSPKITSVARLVCAMWRSKSSVLLIQRRRVMSERAVLGDQAVIYSHNTKVRFISQNISHKK